MAHLLLGGSGSADQVDPVKSGMPLDRFKDTPGPAFDQVKFEPIQRKC
jgi:hypothetical protein